MELLGAYVNGNCNVSIYDDGTKIRETNENEFVVEFPESIDIKITNYCDMDCPYCHENSTVDGKHGNILDAKFIDTLQPYTELAIGGGNPLSHPDLIEFLNKLKVKNIIANITINQEHFIKQQPLINHLSKEGLVHGVGVSFTRYTDELLMYLQMIPNTVLHVINGVVDLEELRKLYNNGLKVLILGYKQLRRGNQFYSNEVEEKKSIIYNHMPEIIKGFDVVSFDNLSITQLDMRRFFSKEKWQEFYMGNDGQFTMYIDMINQEYSKSSTCDTRFELKDNIRDMFADVQKMA